MDIQPRISLQDKNTLSAPGEARWYTRVTNTGDLVRALQWARDRQLPVHLLGGGSNVIVMPRIDGLVIDIAITGRRILASNAESATVEIAAGEDWHQVVLWSLDQGLFGLENLALIPGRAGAAPIQNIGAYGVELSDSLVTVAGYYTDTAEPFELSADECELGYRDSVFKHRLQGRCAITHIRLRLSRRDTPRYDYPALQQYLQQQGVAAPGGMDVANAVMAVRRSKLPDPQLIPNAGSFFKNPVIEQCNWQKFSDQWPDCPSFAIAGGHKVPAAWLIEQAGLKGETLHGLTTHHQQPLVLTNPSHLDGHAVLQAATAIQDCVAEKFGIRLEIEPRKFA